MEIYSILFGGGGVEVEGRDLDRNNFSTQRKAFGGIFQGKLYTGEGAFLILFEKLSEIK